MTCLQFKIKWLALENLKYSQKFSYLKFGYLDFLSDGRGNGKEKRKKE